MLSGDNEFASISALGRTKVESAWCGGLCELDVVTSGAFVAYGMPPGLERSSNAFSRGSMIGESLVDLIERGRPKAFAQSRVPSER